MVEVFRMLADATRVQVLWALVDREMSVSDLASHIDKPAPSVSQHLAKLRMARLVRTRRGGSLFGLLGHLCPLPSSNPRLVVTAPTPRQHTASDTTDGRVVLAPDKPHTACSAQAHFSAT